MKLSNTLSIAVAGIGSHPFRAFLAGLGVVFGVAAVIAMMAIGEGARQESLRQIEVLGVDKIILRSVEPPAKEADTRLKTFGLTDTDRHHFQRTFDNVKDIVPVRNLRTPIYRAQQKLNINVFATTPDFLNLTRSQLAGSGRALHPFDEARAANVCVIGDDAARQLFDFMPAIGQTIQVAGSRFEVVGVIENPWGYRLEGGFQLSQCVFIPMRSAANIVGKVIRGENWQFTKVDYDWLYITVSDVAHIATTAARIRRYLEETHPNNDVEIVVPYELLRQKEATQRIFTIVMASIAAISLLVGGIGIMNIMLANIYERMREIGTRRALGAKRADILLQFLLESIVLTVLGGALGVVLGHGLAAIVEAYAAMPTRINPLAVVLSFAVSVMTGVVFGTFPAWKAANLDPIVALRQE